MAALGRSTSMDLPRREPRHIVPAIGICIQVDFHVEAEPFIGRLHLHHPNIGETITTRAELVWVDELDHVVYAGALFLEPIHFEHTFLNMLMPGPLCDLLGLP